MRGDLFIVSSPSGAGKTTLIHTVMADPVIGPDLHFSVSHTTRAPRLNEQHGREYYFVTVDEFQRLVDADGFLEHATVHRHLYGTSRQEVEPRLEAGVDVIVDIDVQGSRQVRSRIPEAVKIMIFPPSLEALEARLLARNSEDPESARVRLAAARREMAEFGEYDYAIINDRLEAAADELRSIIVARHVSRHRQRERLEAILRGFSA